VAATLGHALRAAASRKTVVIREQALALPPTWKTANENLNNFRAAPSASVLEVGRLELARSLALHDLFAHARGGDLSGPDGRPVAEGVVQAWADRVLEPRSYALALGDDGQTEVGLPPPPPPPDAEPPPASTAVGVLERLRLASLERVVAEVQRLAPRTPRARVLAELRAHPGIRWFGRTIVHLPSERT
jgi:hypothetical protein